MSKYKEVKKLSKKWILGETLILTIYFLILGFIFKELAGEQNGVSVTTAEDTKREYVEILPGKAGADKQKYELLNMGGTVCFILSGITGMICAVTYIKNKKLKR